jgi:hypothetical protein
MIKSTDIEMTTLSSTGLLIYLCIAMILVGAAILVLHVYIIPFIVEAYYRVATALYKFLRNNHEVTGGRGYMRKG